MLKKLLLVGLLLSSQVYADDGLLTCEGSDSNGNLIMARLTKTELRVNEESHPLSDKNSSSTSGIIAIGTETYKDYEDQKEVYLRILNTEDSGQFVIEVIDAKTKKILGRNDFMCFKDNE